MSQLHIGTTSRVVCRVLFRFFLFLFCFRFLFFNGKYTCINLLLFVLLCRRHSQLYTIGSASRVVWRWFFCRCCFSFVLFSFSFFLGKYTCINLLFNLYFVSPTFAASHIETTHRGVCKSVRHSLCIGLHELLTRLFLWKTLFGRYVIYLTYIHIVNCVIFKSKEERLFVFCTTPPPLFCSKPTLLFSAKLKRKIRFEG